MVSNCDAIRVLHVTPAIFGSAGYFGGGERYVHNIAHAVKEVFGSQFQISIVGFANGPERMLTEGQVGIRILTTESFGTNYLGYYSGALWSVADASELMHIHQPFTPSGEFAMMVGAQLGKPMVTTDLGGGELRGPAGDHPIAWTTRVVALSKFAASMVGELDIPIEVVLGPVDKKFLRAPLNLRTRHGALYVGRILPHKGIDRIVRALPRGLRLTIAGTEVDHAYLQHLRDLSRNKQVEFLFNPTDETIIELYSAARVHICASTFVDWQGRYHAKAELMGITALEALASGTPILVSATGSLPELVDGADVGRVFNNETELRELLDEVAEEGWPAPDTSRRCRDYCDRRFGPERVGRRIGACYHRALRMSRS